MMSFVPDTQLVLDITNIYFFILLLSVQLNLAINKLLHFFINLHIFAFGPSNQQFLQIFINLYFIYFILLGLQLQFFLVSNPIDIQSNLVSPNIAVFLALFPKHLLNLAADLTHYQNMDIFQLLPSSVLRPDHLLYLSTQTELDCHPQ